MGNILCTWIGGSDWDVCEGSPKKDSLGPIRRTLQNEDWKDVDEIHLLNNYPAPRRAEKFKNYLSQYTEAKITPIDEVLDSPTDLTQVYDAAERVVDGLPSDARLIFLISPGTYSMQLAFLLIAHNLRPATLIEASREADVQKVNVPFRLSRVDPKVREEQVRNQHTAGLSLFDTSFTDFKHECESMRRVVEAALEFSSTNSKLNLLIEGEAGTGKKLLAQCIHRGRTPTPKKRDPRYINCSAYPAEQLAIRLFGGDIEDRETGEHRRKRGLLERERHDTVVIEEVDSLPQYLQTRLLQTFFQRQESGYQQRLIFTSNQSLAKLVSNGVFRRDLFYWISQERLQMPALRDRDSKDLQALTEHIIETRSKAFAISEEKRLDRSAYRVLESFTFEGNIGELDNVLTRAILHARRTVLTAADIESALMINKSASSSDDILNRQLGEGFNLDELLDEVTTHYLERAKAHTGGKKGEAAKLLGFKSYQNLSNRMSKVGFKWR